LSKQEKSQLPDKKGLTKIPPVVSLGNDIRAMAAEIGRGRFKVKCEIEVYDALVTQIDVAISGVIKRHR
jgi:hypothetical protein